MHTGVPVRPRHGLLPRGHGHRLYRGRLARRRAGRNGPWPWRPGPRIRTSTTDRTSRRRCSRLCFRAGSTPPWPVDASRTRPRVDRVTAGSTSCSCSLPGRRSIPPRAVRASGLYGRSDPPRTRREHAGPWAEPAIHRHARGNAALARPIDAPARCSFRFSDDQKHY